MSIIYITDWTLDHSAKIATFVKNENSKAPQLVLVNSQIFSDSFVKNNKGQMEIEILNESGIDAVLFGTDFYNLGLETCLELIKKSNFYCLSGNIKNKKTNQTIGQDYLLKTVGKVNITVIGINYYSLILPTGIEYRDPEFTVLKTMPLVENRSDFQFILTQTNDTLDLPGDLVFGAPEKNKPQVLPLAETGTYKIEIGYDNVKNINEIKSIKIDIDSLLEDSIVKSIIRRYETK